MKIQCNSCEIAEANVLCCADEAALCWICDEKVHAANKLASKHQRVMLVNSGSQKVKCDICQESIGYIFCLEDRALLCRKCDVAIHTANTYVAQHQRFLITGVQVGLEPKEPVTSPPVEKSSLERLEGASSASVSKKVSPMVAPLLNKDPEMLSGEGGGGGNLPISQVSLSGSKVTGTSLEWSLDEFLSLPDFSQNYGFIESGSPKTDGNNSGDYDWSPIYHATTDEELGVDQSLVQVPELPSPVTGSGLYWPQNYRNSVFVPDINYSSPQLPNKRRRKFDLLQ